MMARLWIAVAAVLSCAALALAQPLALNLYVAKDGNDAWSGKLPEPNADKTDGPFATLERARDVIRAVRAQDPKSEVQAPVTVFVRKGAYELSQTFQLTREDSCTQTAPIVYCAHANEEVRLTGGREIPASAFRPVTDPQELSRLDEAGRGKVMRVDLKAMGITSYGKFPDIYRGNAPLLELFFNDRPMQLARWPNEAWMTIARTVARGAKPTPANPKGTPGAFMYHGDRPQRWTQAEDVMLHGYWCHDWYYECLRVKTIDTATQTITFAAPCAYGLGGGLRRYYALNLIEEIDTPGEWYLDRKTGVLYFWPPSPLEGARVWVSTLATPVIHLKSASYVTLRGLTIEVAQDNGVVIEGGRENTIAGCTLRNLGGDAVTIKDPQGAPETGQHNGVTGCDIYEVGRSGIRLSGGDRNTLTPAKHYAVNNHICRFGRLLRTYAGAIHLDGVGNLAAHNLLHHAPHSAMFFSGNDHTIELNEMHHLMLETHDAGAVYMGRNWTCTGNMIRYNFIHHRGAFGIGSSGVYLDDGNAGNTIFGNVFYKGTWATVLGGSRNTTVENNIFVDCEPAVNVDDRAYNHIGEKGTLILTLAQVPYKQPPWSTRYPYLVHVLEDEPGEPKYNVVAHNVRVGGTWTLLNRRQKGMPPLEQIISFKDNWLEGDPGFVDAPNLNFQLRDDSPVYRKVPGFRKIPFEKIGLYQDEMRATWPVAGVDEARKEPMLADKIIYPPKVEWNKPAAIPACRIEKPIVLDGKEGEEEWPKPDDGKPATVEQTPDRAKVPYTAPKSYALAAYDDECLYVVLINNVRDEKLLTRGKEWGKDDGAEVCFRDAEGNGATYVVHGFVCGHVESSQDAGASAEQAKRLSDAGLKLATSVGDKCWTAEFRIPLKAVGIVPVKGKKLQFNIGVRHVAEDEWLCWAGTEAQNWRVEKAGELVVR